MKCRLPWGVGPWRAVFPSRGCRDEIKEEGASGLERT